MAVPKQHRSKSRQGQLRMHIYLKGTHSVACPKCAKPVLAHTACVNCGTYRGKQVIDVMKKLNKKERKTKEREMAAQEKTAGQSKDLSPEELSRT